MAGSCGGPADGSGTAEGGAVVADGSGGRPAGGGAGDGAAPDEGGGTDGATVCPRANPPAVVFAARISHIRASSPRRVRPASVGGAGGDDAVGETEGACSVPGRGMIAGSGGRSSASRARGRRMEGTTAASSFPRDRGAVSSVVGAVGASSCHADITRNWARGGLGTMAVSTRRGGGAKVASSRGGGVPDPGEGGPTAPCGRAAAFGAGSESEGPSVGSSPSPSAVSLAADPRTPGTIGGGGGTDSGVSTAKGAGGNVVGDPGASPTSSSSVASSFSRGTSDSGAGDSKAGWDGMPDPSAGARAADAAPRSPTPPVRVASSGADPRGSNAHVTRNWPWATLRTMAIRGREQDTSQ
jgi:hypothetical protein